MSRIKTQLASTITEVKISVALGENSVHKNFRNQNYLELF